MAHCPRCSNPAPEGARFCPACGSELLSVSAVPTRLFDGLGEGDAASRGRGPRDGAPRSGGGSAGSTPGGGSTVRGRTEGAFGLSSSLEGARFAPGERIGDRYRIVGLIGRGGMGEVYRADDLKLSQQVALKFLPPELSGDPVRLDKFFTEVRISRQISHPNVCRVYDIVEVAGEQILSMEYIDGEDLSALLRRIGRLPSDKAVEIARQVCAGLAAAHDRGVLHRDLKPANIILDGRGRARITDFGLAALAGEVQGADIRSGTPIYMAPEQLQGREVSVRSDIYALGVVLYEIFTGRRAYEAASMKELMALQDSSRPESPSSHVQDLDPLIERVILRCLEREPKDRPPSALSVAAAIPGGDPLAAALAAGETPSPEMVAAAGGEGALRPSVAIACLAGVVSALFVIALLAPRTTLRGVAGFEKPPTVLIDKARDLLAGAGYEKKPGDSAYGLFQNVDYLKWLEATDRSPERWDRLSSEKKPALGLWYRQSPYPLEALNPEGLVRAQDPPPTTSGMAYVMLDSEGRLIHLSGVPPQIEPGGEIGEAGGATVPASAAGGVEPAARAPAAPIAPPLGAPTEPLSRATAGWGEMFAAAGLDQKAFRSVPSRWLPLYYADERHAWEGAFPWEPEVTARVEASSYKGQPVYFTVIGPWSRPARMERYEPTLAERIGQVLNTIFLGMLLIGAVFLARWNLIRGRGDRRGGFRLALLLLALGLLTWVLRADHVPRFWGEWQQFVRATAMALFGAGLVWLLYLALEPFVRRRWPESIVGWARLVGGDVKDPRVGRDILLGALFGAGMLLARRMMPFLEAAFSGATSIPNAAGFWDMARPGLFLAGRVEDVGESIQEAMVMLFFFFMGIGWSKSRLPGALVFMGISTLMNFLFSPSTSLPARLTVSLVVAGLMTWTLLRYGVLAAIAAFIVMRWGQLLSLDLSGWWAPQLVVLWLLLLILAGYSFRTSLGHASRARPQRA